MSARSLMVMCALAALAHCAKSEIVSAQEEPYYRRIVVNDPTAQIGTAEKHVKTPWMIVSPDGKRGFANEFTTNAISVVSEDGINYYAHQEDENGDRTKVIHFTVDENGIPSRTGEVIDITDPEDKNYVENMKKRKLIGVKNGTLYFYPCEKYGTSLRYYLEKDEVDYDFFPIPISPYIGELEQKCLATYDRGTELNALINVQFPNPNGDTEVRTYIGYTFGRSWNNNSVTPAFTDDRKNMICSGGGEAYTGDSLGNIYYHPGPYVNTGTNLVAHLPGAISGLSANRYEVFATTKATNAFYNVTLGQYNVVKDENGNPKPMVPQTQDGLIRVIDNRKNGGKFLYVTSKGIHSIDD